MSFRYSARSLIKPAECFKNLQRTQIGFTNHLRAFAEKKASEDTKSKKGEEKKPTLKMPGLVHPETLNEELYYAEKSKAQLEQIKRKPESIHAPDKKEK